MTTHRREFLKTAGASTAAIALTNMTGAESPNHRMVLGFIGPGGIGSHHRNHLVTRMDAVVA